MPRVAPHMMSMLPHAAVRADLVDAMWRGDDVYLQRMAPCHCCCDEHTHEGCAARVWFGCRGQASALDAVDRDPEAWAMSYAQTRGMSRQAFYAYRGDGDGGAA